MSNLFSRANGLMTRQMLPVLISLAVLALTALTLTTASAAPRGLTFTVDSTGDAADTNPGDGICHTAKNHCSLRAAIQEANAIAGLDTIQFNLGTGTPTISPNSDLPTITDPVLINGHSGGAARVELHGPGSGNGLHITAGGSTVKRLVLNNFETDLLLESKGGNKIQGNCIGTDATCAAAAATTVAIAIKDSANNLIGGTTRGARNIISPTVYGTGLSEGITISGASASGNKVQGNYIGTDKSGTVALHTLIGIDIDAPSNLIGGTTAAARNIISGNAHTGIYFDGQDANSNLVQGNYIGTDKTGTVALGNGFGIYLLASANNTIGGTDPGARNIISANEDEGVYLEADSSGGSIGNKVEGNYIGTDVTGTADLGNHSNGVRLDNADDTVIRHNLISANHARGIDIYGAATGVNNVFGNSIGTDASGTAPLGNQQGGISLRNTANNLIGATPLGFGNTIAFNGDAGVLVYEYNGTSSANTIRGNRIFSNTGLGIDLGGDGVTPNDTYDSDTGPNGLQNFPVVKSATVSNNATSVTGVLHSVPNASFDLDFYWVKNCDASGHGEGRFYLGSQTAHTNARGTASYSVSLPAVQVGVNITATATDANGNTSEFSACKTAS